ncbi:competence/damage-inducible protein A [Zongyangia hominis]|uniref:Putative competence-damage inducible protein n=1 Tax=Zongyangia hominis TaxID=2763677 RepID=A0A926I6S5_9FIRM|nr:competence/damage-inducible protein A [Zongyangia hominis]MBC8570359.1 competence/damage-inducible protein A [Zongyangia hominis]
MKAEILCVGTELLLGDIVNTNAAFIARELARLGIDVYNQSVVGDNPQRLKESLELALERNDMVIMTGGLGPTYDDLTKETVAELFGRKMVLHQPSMERIERFFQHYRRVMTDNNRKQAYMPEGATVFPNDNGTAPGLAVEQDGKIAILLPGPPREMTPMFLDAVVPYLEQFSGSTLYSTNVHLFGIGESQVETILKEMMVSSQNPTIAPYAKEGEVRLRVTASAKSGEEAKAMVEPAVEKIKEILGEYIYGIDVGDLQTALVKALQSKNKKVAFAESCTGGYLAKRLTEVPGSSSVFDCGVCSYANEIKERILHVSHQTLADFGAVSEQTAKEMARGVRELSGADIGVSTTGIAGPGGGSEEKPVGLVYVGIATEDSCEAYELRLSRGYQDEREYIRYLAGSHAFHLCLKTLERL